MDNSISNWNQCQFQSSWAKLRFIRHLHRYQIRSIQNQNQWLSINEIKFLENGLTHNHYWTSSYHFTYSDSMSSIKVFKEEIDS